MAIVGFKAENIGEWLGQFGSYIDSFLYFGEEDSNAEGGKPMENKMNEN